jgi:hypothetical protein
MRSLANAFFGSMHGAVAGDGSAVFSIDKNLENL